MEYKIYSSKRCTIRLHLGDCMDAMCLMDEGQYDLAIVDPPYGIGRDWEKRNKKIYKTTSYRNEEIPSAKYFQDLMRVSKNQVIWGYNYFTEHLGPTNYLVIWDKKSNNNTVFKYSKAEIAYTSIKIPCNLFSLAWDGYRMGRETGTSKIHPHQKPVDLYRWLLANYAKPGDAILDTHGGSMSIALACWEAGYDLDLYERDADYYKAGVERFERFIAQGLLFV